MSSAAASRRASRPGRLALDTSLAGARTSGIGLYTVELARALASGPAREALWLIGGERRALPGGVDHAPRSVASRTLWMVGEVPSLLASGRPALFHGVCNFALPLVKPRGIRFVLTVHDLIPLSRPETVSRPYRLQFAAWLARSLAIADAVLCVSEATRAELLDRFPAARVAAVTRLGADHAPDRATALAGGPGLDRPFLLHIGALDARKNLGVLLDAFERLQGARGLCLALVGGQAFGSEAIVERVERLRRRGLDVRILGHVSKERLHALVARAELLVCPSGAEGFGLPPLEGLRAGAAVVASDLPAHREVLGSAAELVPAGDADALAGAISKLLSDGARSKALRERGPERAARFSWRRCAEETLAAYRTVLEG